MIIKYLNHLTIFEKRDEYLNRQTTKNVKKESLSFFWNHYFLDYLDRILCRVIYSLAWYDNDFIFLSPAL